MTMKE